MKFTDDDVAKAERVGKLIGCTLSCAAMLLVVALAVAAIRWLWLAGGAR